MKSFGNVSVDTKVYEITKDGAPLAPQSTKKGGYWQLRGNVITTVSVDGIVLFDKLEGLIGISARDTKGTDAMLILRLTDAIKVIEIDGEKKEVPINIPSQEIKDMIWVSVNELLSTTGFSVPMSRNEAIARTVGVDAGELLEASKNALTAVKTTFEVPVAQKTTKAKAKLEDI